MAETLWTSDDGSLRVVHDVTDRFYEIRVGDRSAGLLVYERQAGRVSLTHTFIMEEFRGRGLVNVLIREALGDLRGEGLTVTNRCPVIDGFIGKHPEFADVISAATAPPQH